MNGLIRDDNGSNQTVAEAGKNEELEQLLRRTSTDGKVIFGAQRGVFDLKRAQIENFFHLINQRIEEQNSPAASTCELAAYYSDGSSRKFPSIDDFSEYAETRNRVPTLVTVHLSYFISYPNSSAPEKQEIDITIRASGTLRESLDMVHNDAMVRMSGDKVQLMAGNDTSDLGMISYSINHTRYSWGLDIEGHIRGHIESLLSAQTASDTFFKRIAGPLNLFTTIFVGLYIVNLIIDFFFWFLYQSDGANGDQDVLLIAAEYLVNGHIAKYIVATLVVSVVVFVIFSALVSRVTKSLTKPKPSFIVLSENDEKRREEKLRIYSRRWTRFVATLFLDVAVALLIFVAESRIMQFFGS